MCGGRWEWMKLLMHLEVEDGGKGVGEGIC